MCTNLEKKVHLQPTLRFFLRKYRLYRLKGRKKEQKDRRRGVTLTRPSLCSLFIYQQICPEGFYDFFDSSTQKDEEKIYYNNFHILVRRNRTRLETAPHLFIFYCRVYQSYQRNIWQKGATKSDVLFCAYIKRFCIFFFFHTDEHNFTLNKFNKCEMQ